MRKRYLAYITPIGDIEGKETVVCNTTFLTGDLNHKTYRYVMKTEIFKFYYYGSTLEVVEMDYKNQIVAVHDITKEDAEFFGLSVKSILTLNCKTFDMLASNDITYNMKQNKYYNYCKKTVENIYKVLTTLDDFILRVYIINGAVIYIELDTNVKKNNGYVLSKGYIVEDKNKLKQTGAVQGTNSYGSEKLSQEAIDEIITRLI